MISVEKRHKKSVLKIILSIIAIITALIIAFPIIWMLPASFKDKKELFSLPNHFFPQHFSFINFTKVFQLNDIHFINSMGMTFLVAMTAVFIGLFINMLAAYAFSRLEFPFKKYLFGFIMISMFIPGVTILLTSIRLVGSMGLIDTFLVLVLPGCANAYNIFFFRQFFFGLPSSLEEAAIIDGCNHWKIFFQIFIPLSITPIIIIGIGTFMGYWNSYLWPTLTIIRNTDLKQVMQVLKVLSGSKANDYGVVVAASAMSLIIPVAMFGIFQKYIVQGIAISGIK